MAENNRCVVRVVEDSRLVAFVACVVEDNLAEGTHLGAEGTAEGNFSLDSDLAGTTFTKREKCVSVQTIIK